MKRVFILIITFTVFSNFASALTSTLNLYDIKLKDVQFLSESVDPNYAITQKSYSLNGPSNIAPSTITVSSSTNLNSSYAKDWVKNSLALDGIEWVSGNMVGADSSNRTPGNLYLALKVNLTFVTGIETYECKNVYLGLGNSGVSNWWVFSNNNNKNHTITCRAEGSSQDTYMSYAPQFQQWAYTESKPISFDFIMQ